MTKHKGLNLARFLLGTTAIALLISPSPALADLSPIAFKLLYPYNLASQLGVTLAPDFEGGRLFLDQLNAVYSQNFTVGASNGEIYNPLGYPVTFSGTFTGPGSLAVMNGAVFTGDLLYTGVTEVEGTSVQIGNGGTTGSVKGPVDLYFGGIVFNRSDSVVYAGSVTGLGRLVQAGGTLTLTGTNTYGPVNSEHSTVVSSGTLQLGNGGTTGSILGDVDLTGTLAFNRSDTYTFGGNISGTGSVRLVTSASKLILTGTNTYTGGTTIASGLLDDFAELQIGNGGTTGSIVGDVRTQGAITFDRSDAYTFAGSITGIATHGSAPGGILNQIGSGTLTLTGDINVTTINVASGSTLQLGDGGASGSLNSYGIQDNGALVLNRSGTTTLGGDISGTGTVAQVGSGTTILTGTNTYTGGTTISSGTLQIGNGGTVGSLTGNVLDNSVLAFNRSNTVLFAGAISGTGALDKLGSGTLILSGANTYSGGTSITAGTLQIGYGGATGSLTGNITNNSTLVFSRPDTYTFGGDISGSGSVYVYSGTSGKLILTGTNTYTGGTVIDAGYWTTTGYLQIGDGGTTGSIAGTIRTRGVVAFDRSDTYTFEGNVSGIPDTGLAPGGTMNQIGSGTLVLTGGVWVTAINIASGSTLQCGNSAKDCTLSAYSFTNNGNLVFGGSGRTDFIPMWYYGSGTVTQAGSGTTFLSGGDYTGGATILAGTLHINGSFKGNIVNNSVLALSDGDIFRGDISGTGLVSMWGKDSISLRGHNTFTGGFSISSVGTEHMADLGDYTGRIFDSGTLDFNTGGVHSYGNAISGVGAVTVTGSGSVILTGDNSYTGTTTISSGLLQIGDGGTTGSLVGPIINNATLVFNRSDSATVPGTISGSGGLHQAGSGVLVLTGTNTYTGNTYVDAGMLSISSDANLGNGGILALASGTGVILTGGGTFSHPVTVTGDPTFNVVSGTTATWSGQISDGGMPGDVEVTGGGTLVLTNIANSYSGGTVVKGGSTLNISDEHVLGSGGLTLGDSTSAGTLKLGAGLTSARSLVLGAGGGAIDTNSNTVTLSGTISGTGALAKVGAGTLTLSGANTYSGGTSITAGTLQIGNGGTTGSLTGNITDNAALAFNRSDTYTYAGIVSGSGTVVQAGAGTVIFTGANTYTGNTTISSGTLQIGNGGTSGSIVGNVANNGMFVFNHSDTVAFSGKISGSGGFAQSGSGVLILNGANSYTGTTTVISGSLEIGDAAHPGAVVGGNVVVGSGATLLGSGTVLGSVSNSSGGTVSPGSPLGTLTVGSYTQGSTSTLGIAVTSTAASKLQVLGQASLNGNLALAFDAGFHGTHAYQIVGAGSLAGVFSTVATTNAPANSLYAVEYSPTSVTLVVEPKRSGQIYNDLIENAFDTAERFAGAVFDHQTSRYCNGAASGNDRREDSECPDVEAWFHTIGGTGAHDGNDNADGFNTHFIGAVGGFDVETDLGFSLGLSAFYTRTTLSVAGNENKATVDSYGVAVSGSFATLSGRIDTNVYWTTNNGQTHRWVTPDAQSAIAVTSQPKSDAYGGAIQYSKTILSDDLTALGRIVYSGVNQSAFAEAGGGPFNRAVNAKDYSAVLGEALLRLSHVYHLTDVAAVIPEIALGARANLTSANRDTVQSFAASSGPSFLTPGVTVDRADFIAAAGITVQLREGGLLYLRGDSQIGAHEKAAAITLGGRLEF